MTSYHLNSGCNLRIALDHGRRLGCQVDHLVRTGEQVIRHASVPRRVRFNSRRKDAPRAVVTFLRHVMHNLTTDAEK